MDRRQRRSSILRQSVYKDDETTTNIADRLKRRISFSEKKSIREFCKEKEPKTWNHSYEVSDHTNSSEGDGTTHISKRSSLKVVEAKTKNDTITTSAYKENREIDINYTKRNKINSNQDAIEDLSMLSTTTEFINAIPKNSILHIENSIDITLFKHETDLKQNLQKSGRLSFSLDENEKHLQQQYINLLSMENSISTNEYFSNLNNFFSEHSNKPNTVHNLKTTSNIRKTVFGGVMNESQYCNTKDDQKHSKTIIMDETIKSTACKLKCTKSDALSLNNLSTIAFEDDFMIISEDKNNLNTQRYLQEDVSMDISLNVENYLCSEDVNGKPKVASKPESNNSKRKSIVYNLNDINAQLNITIENAKNEKQISPTINPSVMESLHLIKNSKDKTALFNESNMENHLEICTNENEENLVNNSNKRRLQEQNNGENQTVVVNQTNFNDELIIISSLDNINFNEDENRKPTACLNLNSSSAHKTIVFNQNDGDNDMDFTLIPTESANNPNSEVSSISAPLDKRKTIIFNKSINPELVLSPIPSASNNSENINKSIQSAINDVQRPSASKVVCVRTVLQPALKKPFRYKTIKPQCPEVFVPVKEVHTKPSKVIEMDFTLNNSCLELESQSPPIFPPGYADSKKTVNLRQLHDDIVHGKVQIFPDVPPSIERVLQKPIQNQRIQTETSRLDDEMQLSSLISKQCNVAKLNKEHIAPPIKKNHQFKYQVTDEKLLDNTSFLTQAKLGDETSSRNSSKRQETMLFNSDIDIGMCETFIGDIENPTDNFESQNECVKLQLRNHLNLNSDTEENKMELTKIQMDSPSISKNIANISTVPVKDSDVNTKSICLGSNPNESDICVDIPLGICAGAETISSNKDSDLEIQAKFNSIPPVLKRRTEYFNNDIDVDSHNENQSTKSNMHIENINVSKLIDKTIEKTVNNIETLKLNDKVINCKSSEKISIVENAPIESQTEISELILNRVNNSNESNDSMKVKLRDIRAVTRSLQNINATCVVNVDMDMDTSNCSPQLCNTECSSSMRKLYDGTPHRSVIEFEDLEREADLFCDDKFEKINYKSNELIEKRYTEKLNLTSKPTPLVTNDDLPSIAMRNKRVTANMTPLYQNSKKRHTLIFNDCGMDESPLSETKIQPDKSTRISNVQRSILPDLDLHRNSLLAMDDVDILNEHKSLITSRQKDIKSGEFLSVHEDLCTPLTALSCIADRTCDLVNGDVNTNATSHIGDQAVPTVIANADLQNLKLNNHGNVSNHLQSVTIKNSSILGNSDIANSSSFISRIPILKDSARKKNFNHLNVKSNDSNLNNYSDSFSIARHQIEKNATVVSPFNDNLILISDVSECIGCSDQTLNITEIGSISKSQKEIFLLSSNSPLFVCADLEDIEQTRLSLVETLLDDDDDDDDNDNDNDNDEDDLVYINESEFQNKPVETEESKLLDNISNSEHESCQLIENSFEDIESFKLPSLPEFPELNFERLRKLRKFPTISDVDEYYRRLSLQKTYNIHEDYDISSISIGLDIEMDLNEDVINIPTIKIDNRFKSRRNNVICRRPVSFIKSLEKIFNENQNHWVYDYQMVSRNLIQFTNNRLITFKIVLYIKNSTIRDCNAEIEDIKLLNSREPKKNWKPIDYALDFQLKLELPFKLGNLCKSKDPKGVFEMLQKIDEICKQVKTLGYDLWKIVCRTNSALMRDMFTTYVSKIVRKRTCPEAEYSIIKKYEFKIQILNIKKLSFKDIVRPALYEFQEEIQYLPTGLDFLRIFLEDPVKYLRE